MRSLAGRLEVVGGLDPFAQFDPKALTSEVTNADHWFRNLIFVLP